MSAGRSCTLLIGVAGLLALPATALALPPFTTTAKTSPGGTRQAELYAPAVGCHSTFDRFVFRARVATPRYDVRYVSQISEDGSGDPVSLLGRCRLKVLLRERTGFRVFRLTNPTRVVIDVAH